jgi:hypothetical protein
MRHAALFIVARARHLVKGRGLRFRSSLRLNGSASRFASKTRAHGRILDNCNLLLRHLLVAAFIS